MDFERFSIIAERVRQDIASTQATHEAQVEVAQAAGASLAVDLASAEEAIEEQKLWADKQLSEVNSSLARGLSGAGLVEIYEDPLTIAANSLTQPAYNGLREAREVGTRALRDLESGLGDLTAWQAWRTRIILVVTLAFLTIASVITFLINRELRHRASVVATATYEVAAVWTSAAGTSTAQVHGTETRAAAIMTSDAVATLNQRATLTAEVTATAIQATRLVKLTEEAVVMETATIVVEQTVTASALQTRLAPTPTPSPGTRRNVSLPSGTRLTQVYVPAGSFQMGAALTDPDAQADEFPSRQVVLDAFWIDQTEVTNTQFAAFLNAMGNQTESGTTWLSMDDADTLITSGNGLYVPASGYGDYPIVNVSWYGAQAYCDWSGGRLPTEAEWEYAARGPQGSLYPWGNSFSCALANVDDETLRDRTTGPWGTNCDGYSSVAPVGSFPDGASWVGAVDMAGNVYEWVADWYAADYYGFGPMENPPGPSSGNERVLRGSAWNMEEREALRGADRLSDNPANRKDFVGFRCVGR